MIATRIKGALAGAIIGAIGGPLVGGLTGLVLLLIVWSVQGLFFAQPFADVTATVRWAAVFGLLLAPLSASVGVITGIPVGAFGRFFASLANSGSFGGVVGAAIGLFVAAVLFADNNDPGPMVVAIITLSITGVAVGAGVKQLRNKQFF